ncbi:gp7 [Corynebacterium phage P1201]|uniref:Gp7 n=1 Tax=Corynebacterium phage P1201 TaxID=384848 RepID=A7IY78_9CAUD|nr:gp7 [Corynebacterium phage P1201]ABF57461.1 gp7 [Corynebacterium phage P1201]
MTRSMDYYSQGGPLSFIEENQMEWLKIEGIYDFSNPEMP